MMLSVIIPTLNAEPYLGDCLDRVRSADEIIVVDGGSTDRTVEIAQTQRARLIQAQKGRGVQLQAGAQAARGDWLLFLHADTLPGHGWRRAVLSHQAAHPDKAAFFAFRLSDSSRQARWLEAAVAARVALLGLPYGDQGLLVPRFLHDALGGYRPLPLMEDVDLVRRIGRDRLAQLDESAWTSAAKWRRDGWLRRSGHNLATLTLYLAGISPDRLARHYR